MQIRRHGVRAMSSPGQGFALNSKPFLAGDKSLVGAEAGALVINEDGVDNTYYLPGATTIDGGRTVKYTPPYRFYLMKTPTTDYSDRENFYMPIFPGKTFSVDIDFKGNGPSCGCNLNFYLVSMPWHSIGKDGDWYCDAQCFEGLGCCHEFDMNEGNKAVQQVTNHACTHDYGSHPDWACNKWGDPEVKTHSSDFNAGAGATIDSNKPFTFSQRFDVNGGDFTFTTTLSQEGRQVVMRMNPNHQMNNMLGELQKGMALVTGYWFAQDMNWMDGEVCGSGAEHCNMNPAYISNWKITSNDGPAPAPSPPAPTPAGGKCCWGGCNNCNDDPSNWCNQNQQSCQGCNGQWCA